MKYSASVRYGGQLIDSADCEYNDYKRLGLSCPECKSPVFLRRGERVSPHFAHFKASDPALVKQCELRVGTYGRKDLERRATQARNQRLKFLQRWFWEVYRKWAFRDGTVKTAIEQHELLKSIKNKYPVKEYVDFYVKLITSEDARKALEQSIFAIAEEDLISERIREIRVKVQKCEYNLHQLICGEVIEFLKAKRNLPILEDVIACSFLMMEFSPSAQVNPDKWMPLTNAVVVLCMVPWAEEFQQLDKATVCVR